MKQLTTQTLQTLNRALLRAVCVSPESANLIADRLEALENSKAALEAVNDRLKEELGLLADKTDSLIAATEIPFPLATHVEGLKGGVESIGKKILELIAANK